MESLLGKGRRGSQTGASDPLMDIGAGVTQLAQTHPTRGVLGVFGAVMEAWRKQTEAAVGQGRPGTQTQTLSFAQLLRG